MTGPFPNIGLELDVGFLHGGVQYNEEAITKTIEDAWSQLQASMPEEKDSSHLPVIALWSQSNYLNFSILLVMDADGAQLHDLPERYYLFDWAFSKYSDLGAIILFELKREGDFWNPTSDDAIFPVAFVITNPNLPDSEKVLRAVITENCKFLPGISSDPLSEPISKENV